jgi:phthalate 4,5-dioxygenase oxygenase subunit
MTRLLRDYPRPEIRVDEADYGLRLTALRHLDDGRTHVRVTNQIFPEAICIPMSREMTITQWHVPIDDTPATGTRCSRVSAQPVNKDLMRAQRLKEHRLPDYAPLKNKRNNYGYDPEEQARETYTGMGLDINVHDQWAVESMGPIQDRTQEHLGKTDVGIIRYRRMLRAAIDRAEAGETQDLPLRRTETEAVRGPVSIDAIGPTEAWDTLWTEADAERRAACDWAAPVPA